MLKFILRISFLPLLIFLFAILAGQIEIEKALAISATIVPLTATPYIVIDTECEMLRGGVCKSDCLTYETRIIAGCMAGNICCKILSPTPTSPPTVAITTPLENANIASSIVTVQYRESGDLSQVDHVHLQLDTQPEVRDLDNDGNYVFNNVILGPHTVLVYLAKVDHSRFDNPQSQDTVNFSVSENNPTLTPVHASPTLGPGCQYQEVQCVTVPCDPIVICPTSTPVLPTNSACPMKSQGDANCNGSIDLVDFEYWRREFTGQYSSKNSDFTGDNNVDLADFEFWRRTFIRDGGR